MRANCIGFASTCPVRVSSVIPMNMMAIIALADLTGPRPPDESSIPLEKAASTLDALVSYLDAMCAEWAATPEVDRLAAVHLAADNARQIQGWLKTISEGGPR
jgi:hypothetical protein